MARAQRTTPAAAESTILKALNEKYGKGSVILGLETDEDLEVIDSGSLTLNRALGLGGVPLGKLIEMYGPESSGKSTLCLHMMANFQKAGKKVALVDGEQSFDRKYAKNLGVNIEEIFIVQPSCGEEGYQMAMEMVKSGEFGLIVLDSHTSMIPKKIIDADMGEATMAVQARMNSTALAKLHPLLKPHKCTIVAISQLRTNIGGYGDPNVPTGGHAYKFYSDIRLKVSKLLEKADSINRTTVEVVKNKCAVPFGKATFAIDWGKGIDRVGEIIELCVEKGLIKKGGAWYELESSTMLATGTETEEMNGVIKFQGEAKLKTFLTNNSCYLEELEVKLNGG
jgi:recombination protein RecA